VAPFGLFPTADGWLVVACPKEKFWRRLAETVGRTDLLEDERFMDFAGRALNRAALEAELDDTFRRKTTREWVDQLASAGVPSGRVNSVADALADPQAVARQMIVETAHPTFGPVRQMAGVTRVGSAPVSYRRAPRRGEDARHVLTRILRYEDVKIDRLRLAGAFGEEPQDLE
jgi:crotonobetainyl-CoA:carnitine CoA-transferase CaiB-like acyl-CoA transferase